VQCCHAGKPSHTQGIPYISFSSSHPRRLAGALLAPRGWWTRRRKLGYTIPILRDLASTRAHGRTMRIGRSCRCVHLRLLHLSYFKLTGISTTDEKLMRGGRSPPGPQQAKLPVHSRNRRDQLLYPPGACLLSVKFCGGECHEEILGRI
jgi:hypothetical protein